MEEQSVYDQPEDKPWYEKAWNSTVDFASEYGTKILDVGQVGLDVAGLVPGVGELADGANALIYEARGDHVNAALSGAAMVPFAGWLSTGGKFVNKAVKYSDEGAALVKGAAKISGQTLHGVPQEAADRLMARLKGLNVGGKPVVESVEAFGSRTTGWSKKRNAAVNSGSDLDILTTLNQKLYQSRNKEWISGVLKNVVDDFRDTTNIPLSLHYPKRISEFKQSVFGLDPVAKFIDLFRR